MVTAVVKGNVTGRSWAPEIRRELHVQRDVRTACLAEGAASAKARRQERAWLVRGRMAQSLSGGGCVRT